MIMKQLTMKQYLNEIDNLKKEITIINNRHREILKENNYNFNIDIPELDSLFNKRKEVSKQLKHLEGLLDHTRYIEYYNEYRYVEDYFKEKGFDKLPNEINKKALFIFKNYILIKDDLPKVKCEISPDAFTNYITSKDVDISKKYLLGNKRDYIYSWEIKYLALINLYNINNPDSLITDLFNKDEKIDKSLDELLDNTEYLFYNLEKNKKLNLSLYLWTIYKAYQYLRKLDSDFIIKESNFSLFNDLFKFASIFFNDVEFELDDNSGLTKDELDFIKQMCGLLANDLINTIINSFPDYYDTNIMFLGYGCYIPAGCSELNTSMNTFDSFLKGITDYDYWSEYDINGEELLLEKIKINKDYENLRRNSVFTELI